ncbi:hypothetical protein MOUN0_J05534 [Monosporozyma unispora]|nr:hypothetical protein C6P44_003193 [Kazachstania unispora]
MTEIVVSEPSSYEESIESNTGLIDSTLLESLSLSSDSDVRQPSNNGNNEYSADIKPLEFTIKRKDRRKRGQPKKSPPTPNAESAIETKSKVQARLHGNTTSQPMKKNIFEDIGLFNDIDIDQFERYLKEPNYIKMLKKTKGIKQLRRLFLAQELQVPPDGDIITPTPLDHIANHLTNGTQHINTDSVNGSTLYSRSNSVSPSFSPRPSVERTISNSATSKAIWATKFSHDGKFMATAGKDCNVVLWKVLSSPIERIEIGSTLQSNNDVRAKKLRLQQSPNSSPRLDHAYERAVSSESLFAPVFNPKPHKIFKEHTHDILSLDWSKNNFLLSASMDNTVKLWHPEKAASLKTFKHPDFVTSLAFHPTDDRFFISGCLDHRCRLWSILDNTVSYEFDCEDLITSVAFSPVDAKYTIVGTFNGFIYLLMTRGLEPLLSFHVTDTATQKREVKNIYPHDYKKNYRGPRVTGIEPFIDENDKSLRAIITCNDSRIRVFNLKTKQLMESLKGFHSENSSHIAHINSLQMKHPIILSSSDDNWVYCWKLKSFIAEQKKLAEEGKSSGRSSMTRSRSFKNIFGNLSRSSSQKNLADDKTRPFPSSSQSDDIVATTPTLGNGTNVTRHHSLKITSLLSSSSNNVTPIRNSQYISFRAHQAPVTTAMMAPVETSKVLSLSNDFICELALEFFYKGENRDDISSSMAMTDNAVKISTMFSCVNAIGTILVSTDNKGNIRVFRADISSKLRSIILKSLQEYKMETQHSTHPSSSSLSSLNRSNSLHSSLSSVIRPHSYSNLTNLHEAAIANNAYQSVTKQSSTPKRSRSFTNVHKSLTALTPSAAALTRGSRPHVNGSTTSLAHSIGSDHSTSRASLNVLHCGVCNGTSFEPISKESNNASSKLEGGSLFCRDCGTILNNFR